MLHPAIDFHLVLLIFVNLWPISTLCVADMVHAVADMFADIVVSQNNGIDNPRLHYESFS